MIKIAVCGNLPTVLGILRRDGGSRVRQYDDGAWLRLQLNRESYDLVLVESRYGEGLSPMRFFAAEGEAAPAVYLMAEPPGSVARLELCMLIQELREKKRLGKIETADETRGIQNEETV